MVEPPEPSPDPEVPTSGPEFSSDYATNGPVPEYDVVEPTEPSPDPAVPISGPEYSCDYSGNGPIQQNSVGSRRKQEMMTYDYKLLLDYNLYLDFAFYRNNWLEIIVYVEL